MTKKTQMRTPVDFQKLRKRRQRVQTIKRLFILGVISAVLLFVVVLNNYFVEEGVTVHISDMVESMGGNGYPVDLPGGVIRDVKHSGSYLGVLNDTNLYIYSPKGKLVYSVQQMSENSVLAAGKDRFLTFDIGSRKFAVHSRSKTLLEQELEFGILTGTMNENGDFAIVSSSNRYTAEVKVYNRKLEQVFEKLYAENQVTALSISPKGNVIAIGCLNTRDGVLQGSVEVYQSQLEERQARLLLPEHFVLDIRFQGEDKLAVLTDREYFIMDTSGTVLHSYSLEGREISAFERNGKYALLLCNNRESRTYDLLLLDASCELVSSFNTKERINDMALATRQVYLLTDAGISVRDFEWEEQRLFEARNISTIHLVESRLYYLTADEICMME